MRITHAQLVTAVARIKEVMGPRHCSVCDGNKWELDDAVYQLGEFPGTPPNSPATRVNPVLALTCSNCGNTVTLNAIKLGILSPQDTQKTEGGKHE